MSRRTPLLHNRDADRILVCTLSLFRQKMESCRGRIFQRVATLKVEEETRSDIRNQSQPNSHQTHTSFKIVIMPAAFHFHVIQS